MDAVVLGIGLEPLIVDVLPNPRYGWTFEFDKEHTVVVLLPALVGRQILPADAAEIPVYDNLLYVELDAFGKGRPAELLYRLPGVVDPGKARGPQECVGRRISNHAIEEFHVPRVECVDEVPA